MKTVDLIGGFKEKPTENEKELCHIFGAYIISKSTGKRLL